MLDRLGRAHPRRAHSLAVLVSVASAVFAASAAADEPESVTFRAGEVEADARLRELLLRDGAVVSYGRYRIEGEAIRLSLKPRGVEVQGEARLSLCPCPDAPVTIAFRGARAHVDGDITLRFPRIEVLGVPVFALPWLWLRSAHQIGLLPPLFSWRGADGLLLGAGLHVPWAGEGGAPRVFEATIGGYIKGGIEASGRLETPTSTAKVTWDWLREGRAALDARGYAAEPSSVGAAASSFVSASAAWDVDAIRGERARSGTVDLGAAAEPFDAALVETSIRAQDPDENRSAIASTSAVFRAFRGDGRGVAGPRAAVALGGSLSSRGSWDAAIEGAVLRADLGEDKPASGPDLEPPRAGALPLASAWIGGEITARPGPFEVRASSRGLARIAAPDRTDPSREAAAGARVELALPLARSFGRPARMGYASAEAPLVHVITPSVEARAALLASRGAFFRPVDPPMSALSWMASAGASTSLGQYTGRALRAGLRAGVVGWGSVLAHGMAHARAAVQSPWLAGDLEAAAAHPFLPGEADPLGFTLLARARLGRSESVSLRVGAAAELGDGAGAARAVAEGAASALPATPVPYLAADGWTGNVELALPWSRGVRTVARADVDVTGARLLALGGALTLVHPCGCLSVVAKGAYRAGREGADVALGVDLTPSKPGSPPELEAPPLAGGPVPRPAAR